MAAPNDSEPPATQPERDPAARRTAAIVGAGSIGVAWAVVFATAGHDVRVHDLDEARRALAEAEIASTLDDLEAAGVLDGTAAAARERISVRPTLAEALDGACYVQECIGEDIGVKRQIFALLDELAGPDAVLASSSSTIAASSFAEELRGRDRCLVVHPGNPPYFLRVAEVVPAPFTSQSAIEAAVELLTSSGIAAVMIEQEVEGFVFNRLQGALLREAYCLVRDGVVSPEDLDTLVREGLGLRWSVLGPFTTSELNTRGGLRRHGRLLGPVYARFGLERAGEDPWSEATIERVAQAIEASLPHDSWEANVRERDRAMVRVMAARRGLENPLVAPAARPAAPVTQGGAP